MEDDLADDGAEGAVQLGSVVGLEILSSVLLLGSVCNVGIGADIVGLLISAGAGAESHVAGACQEGLPPAVDGSVGLRGIQDADGLLAGADTQTQSVEQHIVAVMLFYLGSCEGCGQLGKEGIDVGGVGAVAHIVFQYIGIGSGAPGGSAVGHEDHNGHTLGTGLEAFTGDGGILHGQEHIHGRVQTCLDEGAADNGGSVGNGAVRVFDTAGDTNGVCAAAPVGGDTQIQEITGSGVAVQRQQDGAGGVDILGLLAAPAVSAGDHFHDIVGVIALGRVENDTDAVVVVQRQQTLDGIVGRVYQIVHGTGGDHGVGDIQDQDGVGGDVGVAGDGLVGSQSG